MPDDEKIVGDFKAWIASFDDEKSKRIKSAYARGCISLSELIDTLVKHETKMIRRDNKCQTKQS